MDNRANRQMKRAEEQKMIIAFIAALLIVFILIIFMDRTRSKEIKHRPYDGGEVKTYDGSLNRNLANPLGSE